MSPWQRLAVYGLALWAVLGLIVGFTEAWHFVFAADHQFNTIPMLWGSVLSFLALLALSKDGNISAALAEAGELVPWTIFKRQGRRDTDRVVAVPVEAVVQPDDNLGGTQGPPPIADRTTRDD